MAEPTDSPTPQAADKASRAPRTDSGVNSGIYGFAFLGAAFYYLQHATSFWDGLLGLLKAIAWPAIVMYKVLDMLKL